MRTTWSASRTAPGGRSDAAHGTRAPPHWRCPGPARDKEVAVFVPGEFLPNPHDPWQSPRWRWLRAGYLLDHGRQPLRRDDEATRTAWLFRRELGRCRPETDDHRLARRFPALADAYGVFTAAEPLRRWEVEARLLAGEDDAAIAAGSGMTPVGVQTYHTDFYEVRPHLQAGGYIACAVLGGKTFRGIVADDHETIL